VTRHHMRCTWLTAHMASGQLPHPGIDVQWPPTESPNTSSAWKTPSTFKLSKAISKKEDGSLGVTTHLQLWVDLRNSYLSEELFGNSSKTLDQVTATSRMPYVAHLSHGLVHIDTASLFVLPSASNSCTTDAARGPKELCSCPTSHTVRFVQEVSRKLQS